jgi:hypothetical protein
LCVPGKGKEKPKGGDIVHKKCKQNADFFENYYYNLKKGGRSAVKCEVRVILGDIHVPNQPQIKGEDL